MPPRLITATAPAAMQADASSYSLDLLADYAQTLDSLPLDLSRIFADLRELDAVLTSTVTSLTSKIYKLIELIETRSVSSEERLWLLGEIADEAQKVRPGAEDKIRIATTAADELRGQSSYLSDLVTALPEFQSHLLVKKTTYPHVSAKAYLMPTSFETGRRRRAQNTASAGGWLGVADGSPNKKRRVLQEEDLDYAGGKSPRKEKTGDGGQQRPRGGPRPKKTDRIPSPSDSLRSMQSPMPGVNVANASGGQRNGGAAQRAGQGGSSKRRPNNQNGDNGSLLDSVLNRKENAHGHPPSSSHPSLPKSEHNAQNHESGNNHGRNNHGHSHSGRSGNHNGDASGAVDQRTDGLGVSGARASTQSSLTTNLEHMHDSPAPGGAAATPVTVNGDGIDGDGEADNDDNKTYCYCENVSYGEMIGCDGDQCTREWFHLACVGLTATPKGQWYCDECMAKRKQRNNKNGKKRAGGGGRANQRGNGV